METEDLVSGIAALAGSMTVLAIGMKAMDGVKQVLVGILDS